MIPATLLHSPYMYIKIDEVIEGASLSTLKNMIQNDSSKIKPIFQGLSYSGQYSLECSEHRKRAISPIQGSARDVCWFMLPP